MSITGNDELLEVAAKVEGILKSVVDRILFFIFQTMSLK